MKKLIFGILFIPSIIFASEDDSPQTEGVINKIYDHRKFCYYEDKKFSEGARHFQVDKWKTCTREKSGFLIWESN